MKQIQIEDKCPVARTLKIVGEKWTILILRDLFKNKTRKYKDFSDSLSGISPNLLSTRLKKLESYQLVTQQQYSSHPPRYEYLLTKKGKSLGIVLNELKSWGEEHTTMAVRTL
jgi:DNA-binding HxlR family transcriptional regulator